MKVIFRSVILLFICLSLSSCLLLPKSVHYTTPPERPAEIEEYYSKGSSFLNHSLQILAVTSQFRLSQISIETETGQVTVDYFQSVENGRIVESDNLIMVFPVLGGKNKFSGHFAKAFVKEGHDAAIVHRSKEFKDPEKVEIIEKLFRDNVVRDRIALDYFEAIHGKKHFGSFGISRGAINAAMTAGVDERLKSNVFALGGSDLPKIFDESNVGGIRKYQRRAAAKLGLNEEQLNAWFREQIKTDPKNLAKYIDSNGTMLILAAFDSSVPFTQGLKLRQQMGRPKTVILPSTHVTALLFTQFVPLLLPEKDIALFPFDYVESESISFYNESFDKPQKTPFRLVPFRVLQMPFEFVLTMFDYVF